MTEAMKLRDGSQTYDRRLDLIRNPERRNLEQYHVRDLLAAEAPESAGADEGAIWQPSPFVLDQGREGACVGFAFAADFGGAPLRRMKRKHTRLTQEALGVYHRAQELDPWPETGPGGTEEGTSVEAGARAAVEAGHFEEFRWGENTNDLALALMRGKGDGDVVFGPAIIGVEWRENMYEAPDGLVDNRGRAVGGHAIWVRGVRIVRANGFSWRRFLWRNSWGPGYGINGDAEIDEGPLADILGPDPEICFPVGRARRRRGT